MKTRNSEVLVDFIKYCEEHPDERFWQALRNWSGHPFVYVSNIVRYDLPAFDQGKYIHDTFYTEKKDLTKEKDVV